MRAAALLDSDPAAAARVAGEVLSTVPGHPEATWLLAAACRRSGDSAGAASALESLPVEQQDTSAFQLELGRAYSAVGRHPQALEAFRRAVALEPGLSDAWRELARELFAAGRTREGDEAYGHFSRLTPDSPALSDAKLALGEGRLEAAEGMLRQRLAAAPGDVVALRMLASSARRREDAAESERCLRECLALAPGYAAARYDLAQLLQAQHRNLEALPLVDRLLESDPDHVDYLTLKAQALRFLGHNEEALSLVERAIAAHPRDDEPRLLYGHLLREVGKQDRAIEAYRGALTVRPSSGPAYWSLANLKTFRFDAADVSAMRAQLAAGAVAGRDRTHLEFALGKALEDDGEFATSFAHYASANARQHQTLPYDPQTVSADIQRLKTIYTAGFFAKRAGWGAADLDPIFIVGLPRSGSTLLEQMLASHSQIEGTRELPDLPALALEVMSHPDRRRTERVDPNLVLALQRHEVDSLASRYLSATRAHRSSGKPRFIDKMLVNFGNIGLIHVMLPRATIIDMRRHPLGCGFSCYKQLFAHGHGFSYDLTSLGHYYRDYVELMEHFDAVLPGRVHRVYYERLVADPQGELTRVLEHCGLPFERQCLSFHENPRVVKTISSEQVRRPLYAESVDQWRHYEPWLGPLREALGPLVDRYPVQPGAPSREPA